MVKKEGKEDHLDHVIPRLKEMLHSMGHGSITLIIQDGKVIQIEKNEKVRLK